MKYADKSKKDDKINKIDNSQKNANDALLNAILSDIDNRCTRLQSHYQALNKVEGDKDKKNADKNMPKQLEQYKRYNNFLLDELDQLKDKYKEHKKNNGGQENLAKLLAQAKDLQKCCTADKNDKSPAKTLSTNSVQYCENYKGMTKPKEFNSSKTQKKFEAWKFTKNAAAAVFLSGGGTVPVVVAALLLYGAFKGAKAIYNSVKNKKEQQEEKKAQQEEKKSHFEKLGVSTLSADAKTAIKQISAFEKFEQQAAKRQEQQNKKAEPKPVLSKPEKEEQQKLKESASEQRKNQAFSGRF